MIKRERGFFSRLTSQETGQALIIVLVFILLGSLTIIPTLTYMSTALKSGVSYETNSKEYYAADAGIEDGIWQIKYDRLVALSGDPNFAYNFEDSCSYSIDDPINGFITNVTIENFWIPTAENPYATPAVAKATLERDITDNETNRLVVTDTALDFTTFRIKIDFYPEIDVADNLSVSSIGIWIPHGFRYDHNCNLATFEDTAGKYTETVDDSPGGQVIVWDFSADPLKFPDLPPEELDPSDNPQSAEITFNYIAEETGTRPVAVAWIVTSGTLSSDIPMAWDIDTKYYKITAAAGDTTIEGYASRCDLRQIGAAFPGDYVAIGNTLLEGDTIRDTWVYEDGVKKSSITLNTIPNGNPEKDMGDVISAYLYWSGSFTNPYTTAIWGPDSCGNFNNWTNTNPSTVWQVASVSWDNRFRGHFNTSSHNASARYLTMKNPVDLHTYTPGNIVVEWRQSTGGSLEPADGVTFEISTNNGSTWSSPPVTAFSDDIQLTPDINEAYYYYILPQSPLPSLLKIRFHLESTSDTNEYCYIDDIAIARITATADTSAKFWINDTQVYLNSGEPAQGAVDITADSSCVEAFEKYGEYAYACKLDVTELVKEYAEVVEDEFEVEHPTGNAKYSVGGVDANTGQYRSYAGWSLIIIYSSPETAGHQLYLFDTLALNSGYSDLDFDGDGTPGGKIKGFIVPEQVGDDPNAAKLTCFVGEGDDAYDGDFIAFNVPEAQRNPPTSIPDSYKLWDGTTPMDINDVWNSKSSGTSVVDGIDIDTFSITWASGLLHADDTEAYIDLYTGQDNWMLIYMILSVKSKTTIGGTTHYLITRS